ncbi:hypothetical protein, partial [Catenovulum agarivorans]|uniref:hypothetical protein n=1 Tax=Catenovulum agarivorans TaxID=1172192 RepID=UPI00058B131D
ARNERKPSFLRPPLIALLANAESLKLNPQTTQNQISNLPTPFFTANLAAKRSQHEQCRVP